MRVASSPTTPKGVSQTKSGMPSWHTTFGILMTYYAIKDLRLFSHQEFHDGASRLGNRRTGAEDGCYTCLVEEIIVLSRDNTTSDNHNVGTTEFLQFLNHLRHKGLVSCSQRGNTQYMHVVFNGLLGCLCRSLELWSYNLF